MRLPGVFVALLVACSCTMAHAYVRMHRMEELETLKSSHKCIQHDRPEQSLCILSNVIMFNGTIYYLIKPSATPTTLPAVHISLRPDEQSPVTLQPVTVRQTNLPFDWSNVKKYEIDTSILANIPTQVDLQLLIGQYIASLHNALCENIQKCALQDRYKTILLNTAPYNAQDPGWSRAATEAFTCVSSRVPLWVHHPDVSSKAFILRTAVLGYGTTCVGDAHMCRGEDSAYTGWARQPAKPEIITQFIERMQHCMGLDPGQTVNVKTPSVLVVDREYEQGRAMVNAADVMRGLRRMLYRRFLPGVSETRLVRFRGTPLRWQARVMHHAAVVVVVHGPAIATTVFMSRHAALVHIVPTTLYPLQEHVSVMVGNMRVQQLQLLELLATEPKHIQLMTDRVLQSKEYAALSMEERMALLEHKQCPVSANGGVPVEWCAYNWLYLSSNLHIPLDRLISTVDDALDRVVISMGQPWNGERRALEAAAVELQGRSFQTLPKTVGEGGRHAGAPVVDGFDVWRADALSVMARGQHT